MRFGSRLFPGSLLRPELALSAFQRLQGSNRLRLVLSHYSTTQTSKPALQQVDSNEAILQAQRQNRPLSPHLSIYEPQLTWLMSIGHRMTGAALSGGIYLFGLYYALAQPGNITTEMAGWIAHDCPTALVYAGKYILAAPFLYHTFNGIRHLVWDMVWGFSLKNVYLGGWMVNIGTLIGAGLLTFLY